MSWLSRYVSNVQTCRIRTSRKFSSRVGRAAGRTRHLSTEEVQHVKELLAQVGSLVFEMVANQEVDGQALTAGQKEFPIKNNKDETADQRSKRQAFERELDDLAIADKPPPPPPPPEAARGFKTPTLGPDAYYTYSWVELSKEFRFEHGLANPRDSKGNLLNPDLLAKIIKGVWPDKDDQVVGKDDHEQDVHLIKWKDGEHAPKEGTPYLTMDWLTAADEGQPYQAGFGLVYSRDVKSLKLADRDRDKKYEYFLLTCDAESPEKKVTGDYLNTADAGVDGNVTSISSRRCAAVP